MELSSVGGATSVVSAVVQSLSVAIFVALAVYGGVRDVATYTIPNWIPLAISGAFAASVLAGRPSVEVAALHVAAAAAVFAGGLVLFHFNALGGGDVKLMAAAALWTGFSGLPGFVLLVTCYGGLLTLVLLTGRTLPVRLRHGHPAVERLVSGRQGVPYGLAIAAGVLTIVVAQP